MVYALIGLLIFVDGQLIMILQVVIPKLIYLDGFHQLT